MTEFVHLHGHSHFSNHLGADALGSPEAIVARAVALGMTSICITDHASIMAAPNLCAAAKKAGIKPIVGAELYVTSDLEYKPKRTDTHAGPRMYKHLVALATNWDGVVELFGLLSKANEPDHFHYKPRNTLAECGATKSLVFLTACAGGLLADENAESDVAYLAQHVGKDRLYLEIQPHLYEAQIAVNKKAVELAAKFGLGLVATQDFHYPTRDLNTVHEFYLAIGHGQTWSDPKRFRYAVNDLYIKSKAEMVAAFMTMVNSGAITIEAVAQGINNAAAIGERLNVEWKKMPVSLPKMSDNEEKMLMQLCIAGMKKFGLMNRADYIARLQYEFEVMQKSGFLGYFLVLEDIITWCRSQNIMVGPARGSSGGSLICYLIGITQLDPILHGLIFERFFRPGRVDLPDIDTDFEDERRDEVLAYIRKRFGTEHVSGVANYNTLGAKSAIMGVARTLGVDRQEVFKATVPIGNVIDDEEVWGNDAVKNLLKKYPLIEGIARKLCGTVSALSQHAAGVVIAGVPISERSVVWQKEERHISCWDKLVIEDLGLMKLDVLGLRTLSIMRNAAHSIRARHGIAIEFTKIPLNDAKALELFQKGLTTGVFQYESNGMRSVLKSLVVNRFETLADVNALYRPGPMDLIPVYTMCQTGKSKPMYAHPALEPILGPTYGVCVYQEQMMEIFRQIGGFTYAEADNMRKIVGKKLGPDEFKKHTGAFVEGAKKNGMDETAATRIFNDLVAFAGYAFNKSHAVAYALIGYWTAYLKANFPADFYAAHIANSDDAQVMMAVTEASRLNIRITMPDINRSHATKFIVLSDNELLAPLSAVKGLGPKIAETIYLARLGKIDSAGKREDDEGFNAGGEVSDEIFTNEDDFLKRLYKRIVNTKPRGLLERIGALPWKHQTDDDLHMARIECLSTVYKQNIVVDPGALCNIYEPGRGSMLNNELKKWDEFARSIKMHPVFPAFGKKASIMLMFEKPGWNDVKHGQMTYGDDYDFIRKLLKDQLGLNAGSFYTTSYFKHGEPPLKWESVEAETLKLLQSEFETVNPPLVIAFGKRPIEFFAGKGSSVGDLHGQIVIKGRTPVICSMSAWQAVMEPAKAIEFDKIIEAIKSVRI